MWGSKEDWMWGSKEDCREAVERRVAAQYHGIVKMKVESGHPVLENSCLPYRWVENRQCQSLHRCQ